MGIVDVVKGKCMNKDSQKAESKAFFLKMVGDYYRYVAESAQGDKLKTVKDGALDFYQ